MEKYIYYLVGQNIKKQRKLKGLTQLELANRTFFSYENETVLHCPTCLILF